MRTFKPEICNCCGQTKTYAISIDTGTVHILKQIAKFIGEKGINCVHPRKEMEGRFLTSNEVGNLSRPRLHGLIAKIKDNPGNYCLTTKGASFLKGAEIPKIAIVLKATEREDKRNVGYFNEEEERCTINDFRGVTGEFWEGIGYSINEGRVVYDNIRQEELF